MRHFLASRVDDDPVDPVEHAELRVIIDDELGKLPTSLRATVVLCDLGGKSRAEAARELACPEGTLTSRLEKARRILADRLTRRGVAVPAAGVSTLLAPALTSAVPATLAATTLAAALGAATASPATLHLAEGVVRTMTANKLKLWAAPWLVLAVVTGGTVARSRGNPPARPVAVSQPAAVPVRARGVTWKEAKTLETSGWLAGSVAYSPDGKRLFVGGTGRVRAYEAATFKELWTADVNRPSQHFAAVSVSSDSKTIAATFSDGVKLFDAANGKLGNTLEEVGSKPTVVRWFRDGLGLGIGEQPDLTTRRLMFDGPNGYVLKWWQEWPQMTVTRTGWNNQVLGFGLPLAPAPEGKRVVVLDAPHPRTRTQKLKVWYTGDHRDGVRDEFLVGHNATVISAAWSADGGTIVTGDADGVAIVWDAATFKEKAKVGFDQRIASVAVTADGKRFAVGVICGVQKEGAAGASYFERVYVLNSANPAKSPPALPVANDSEVGGQFSGVAGLTFSPDGKSLAAAFADFRLLAFSGRLIGRARVWTLDAAKPDPNPPASPPGW